MLPELIEDGFCPSCGREMSQLEQRLSFQDCIWCNLKIWGFYLGAISVATVFLFLLCFS